MTMATGGSMGLRYVLQLLFSEKITKQPLRLDKKISTDLECLEFQKKYKMTKGLFTREFDFA